MATILTQATANGAPCTDNTCAECIFYFVAQLAAVFLAPLFWRC